MKDADTAGGHTEVMLFQTGDRENKGVSRALRIGRKSGLPGCSAGWVTTWTRRVRDPEGAQ